MSKPTLGQIVEIVKQHSHYVWIIQGEEPSFVQCKDVIEVFGDVEVKDLGFNLSSIVSNKPCNEFKATFRVFI